jgi:hypothetical protein
MSKAVLLFLSLGAVLLPVLALAQLDLSRYQDKNRVLLIFAPSKTDPRWRKQNALLKNSAGAFRDRDLVRLDDWETGGTRGAALRTRYGVKPGHFRVLLIGKDGHIASGSPAPISISELTAQIDRMPMRREEMRRRGR